MWAPRTVTTKAARCSMVSDTEGTTYVDSDGVDEWLADWNEELGTETEEES